VDLRIRSIHHRNETRVRAHPFLCLLAHYLEWQMRKGSQRLLRRFRVVMIDFDPDHHCPHGFYAPERPSFGFPAGDFVRCRFGQRLAGMLLYVA